MLIGTGVLPVLCAGLLLLGLVALMLFRARSAARKQIAAFSGQFVVKPYLQLGDNPQLQDSESMEVVWYVKPDDASRAWSLQVRSSDEEPWRHSSAVMVGNRLRIPEGKKLVDPHADSLAGNLHKGRKTVQSPVGPVVVERTAAGHLEMHVPAAPESVELRARAENLKPGSHFQYRLLVDNKEVFAATGLARNSKEQSYSFAVAGDLGVPMREKEQKIANQISLASPNFLVIPGDIVYHRGRIREYLAFYFPVYNSDTTSPDSGGPILRSLVTFGVPGNHDVAMPSVADRPDFDEYSDLLGYYLFWRLPMNGPSEKELGTNAPQLKGKKKAISRFRKAAGERFPRMSMYSYDWGNSHWLMLDGNAYMDWTDKALQDWVDRDLAAAAGSTWKFVCFHQPAFSSDGKHANEQRMRLLAPIFERHGVDVAFAGHSHCYERSRPVRFQPDAVKPPLATEDGAVSGTFQIDTAYDGTAAKRPEGVIYIISGAAGAKMYPEGQPTSLQPYTVCHYQETHSYTLCSVNGSHLVVKEINEDGVQVDGFEIRK